MQRSALGLPALGLLCAAALLVPSVASQDTPTFAPPVADGQPVPNSYIVRFRARSFDLEEFRRAVYARVPAWQVAEIVERMDLAVRRDQADFVRAVEALGAKVADQWWIINGASVVDVAPQLADELAALPNVEVVEQNRWHTLANTTARNSTHHEADQANTRRNAQNELVTGAGVGVAILDTGVDGSFSGSGIPHAGYFIGGNTGNNQGGGLSGSRLKAVFGTSGLGTEDVHSHGTHVSGSVASDAAITRGLAPGAWIIGVKISNDSGSAQSSWIVSGWQLVAAQRVAHNIVAANNSFSGSPSLSNSVQVALDEAAFTADVVAVCAAGNSGANTASSQNVWNGLAAGSLVKNTLAVSSFSGRGPLDNFGRTYPDITAVGSSVTSMLRDGTSTTFSGTSMASPMVAGGAALVRDANPQLTALETKAVLLNTTKHTQNDRNNYGLGVLDCDEAVQQAIARNVLTQRMNSSQRVFNKTFTATATGNMNITATWMHRGGATFDNVDMRIYDGAAVVASDLNTLNSYEHVDLAAQSGRTYRLELTWVGTATMNDLDVAIAGVGAGAPVLPPTLASINPGQVDNSSGTPITLIGANLGAISSISVGSTAVTSFTIVDPTQVSFSVPSPGEIGTHSVTVTNSAGTSNPLSLRVVGTHPAVLSTPTTIAVRGFQSTFSVIGDRGWATVLFVSNRNTPSTIPGIVSLSIGNNFASLYDIGLFVQDTRGAASTTFVWPGTIPAGAYYLQGVPYDPSNIVAPLEVTNMLTMTVF